MQSQTIHKPKYTQKAIRKRTKEGKYLNQYLKIKTIGQGPLSKIKLMIDKQTNISYAMKKYNLFILKKKIITQKTSKGQIVYKTPVQDVRQQIKIMSIPNHKNVIKLYEIIEDKQNQKIYLFMDYCQKGDIAKWNQKKFLIQINNSIASIKSKFIQIAKGVQYLHRMNIVHRDLKPQNILLDKQGIVKIIDFGRSVLLKSPDQKLRGSFGTYHFMAPQMLSQKCPEGYDGKLCDIWSLGVSFYGILFGNLPFYIEPIMKLFNIIQQGKYQFPKNYKEQYKGLVEIIKRMLKVEIKERPTIQQVLEMLQKL